MTTTTPEYRKPWQHGAYAYPEVDTFEGIRQALYRKRQSFIATVKQGTPLFLSESCAVCGNPLTECAPDATRVENARVTLDPKTRTAQFRHYVCGWTTLFTRIAAIRID